MCHTLEQRAPATARTRTADVDETVGGDDRNRRNRARSDGCDDHHRSTHDTSRGTGGDNATASADAPTTDAANMSAANSARRDRTAPTNDTTGTAPTDSTPHHPNIDVNDDANTTNANNPPDSSHAARYASRRRA